MAEEKTTVKLTPALLAEATEKQNAFVIVLNTQTPALLGRMFKVDKPEIILGRSADANVQLEDDGISRRHAKIIRVPGGYSLVDLGSTNGTFLNADKVEVAPLTDGDRIQVGPHTVLKFSVQDELEEQYQRSIYENATRDGLTRIFNRKYFMDALRKEFAYCLRHRVALSLILFDVDHFKKVNDTFGHPAGDHVLVKIAQRVSETVRSEDLFARYGGEEFALLLRETAHEKAFVCAERCRKAVESADFTFNGTPIRATISLGVATLLDSDFSQPEELLQAADKLLYQAKQGGRNRTEAKRR